MPSTFDLLGQIREGSRLFSMDILKMLAELRAEKQRLEEAILTLERLARGQGRRRGRPPKWMSTPDPAPATKRRLFSAATRKKMADAQRKRWAARHTHKANA